MANVFPKSLLGSLRTHQLIDTWRALNTGAREFTHYSCPHDIYAKLDYNFSSPILLANSSSATIHTCPWSDHHLVSFQTSHIGLSPMTASWRLNDSLLTDPEITSQLVDHLAEYFRLNDVEYISSPTLWAAHKAVLCGLLIEIATIKKRQKIAKIKTLTLELGKLYHVYTQSHSPEILREINKKRVELDTILSDQKKKSIH